MHKKILSLLVVLSLTFSTCYSVMASPQDTINENKAKFEQLSDKIMSLNSKISGLNDEINVLNDELDSNSKEISSTEEKIDNTEDQIVQVKSEIEKGQTILGKRMRAVYKNNGSQNNLTYLLSSDSFSDFVSRITAVNKIISLDQELISDLNVKRDSLDSTIKDLSVQKDQLEQLRKSTEENLEEIKLKKSEQQQEVNNLNNEKKEVASIIESNENLLVSNKIDIIYSSSSSKDDIESAINSLKALLPQISSGNVISKMKKAINAGLDKITPKPEVNLGGNGDYKATYTMTATAYYGHTITAMGTRPVRNPNGLSTIAVDPRVIPLGTKVYIPGYGYAIAADTGGVIKGNKIDLFMNSREEAYSWGRRPVTLHVVAYPGEW